MHDPGDPVPGRPPAPPSRRMGTLSAARAVTLLSPPHADQGTPCHAPAGRPPRCDPVLRRPADFPGRPCPWPAAGPRGVTLSSLRRARHTVAALVRLVTPRLTDPTTRRGKRANPRRRGPKLPRVTLSSPRQPTLPAAARPLGDRRLLRRPGGSLLGPPTQMGDPPGRPAARTAPTGRRAWPAAPRRTTPLLPPRR